MIQANELRIGNYILFCTEIDTVTEISISDSGYCRNQGYFNLDKDYIEPIPLTHEILNSFGFSLNKEYSDFTYFEKYHVTFNDYFSICYSHGFWHCQTIAPNLEIKYVHQLQNLYFALTGEELTFKP